MKEVGEVDVITKQTPEQLKENLPHYDAMVVRSETKVTADILKAAGDRLKVIGRAGAVLLLCVVMVALLLASGAPAHATDPGGVSLRLSSAGVISGPTTLTVDGIITPGGYWTDLKGAQVCITYDPAKVTISSATAASGWNYEIAVDHTDTHIYQTLFTTSSASLTTSGPIFSFTVTPVNGPVDTSDCSVLKIHGGNGYEMWPVSELVSGDFNSVWVYDACPDDNALYLADNDPTHQQGDEEHTDSKGDSRGTGGVMGVDAISNPGKGDVDANGQVDMLDAVHAARMAVSPAEGTFDQRYRADIYPVSSPYIGDGEVTWNDAADLLRIAGGLLPNVDVVSTPDNVDAYATGSGKVTLYWNGMPNATGYNIYRGTVSGGPYNKIASNVSGSSYAGSSVFMYSDTGLTDGSVYYYAVTGIPSSGPETGYSNEASAVPDPYAVPWDTRDAFLILNAFADAFPEEPDLPYLRIVGPDGTIYDNSAGTQPPDAVVLKGTNQARLRDGSILTLPNDFTNSGGGGVGPMIPTQPVELNRGPFRRVRTASNYRGCQGTFFLPPVENMDIHAARPGNPPVYTDVAFTYLGMSLPPPGVTDPHAPGGVEVDAGLQWSPVTNSWAAFMSINGRYVNNDPGGIRPLVNLPPGEPRVQPNRSVRLTYYSYSNYNGVRQPLSLLVVRGPQFQGSPIRTLGAATPLRQGVQNSRAKRMSSIAQPTNRLQQTGSSFSGMDWSGGQVLLPNGTWMDWGDQPITNEDVIAEGNFGEARVDFTPRARYISEDDIGITINPDGLVGKHQGS